MTHYARCIALLLIVMHLAGCATTVTNIRQKYDKTDATDAIVVKDYAECEQEGENAGRGALIASWATMILAFTVIGAVIPIGLAVTSGMQTTTARDRCMAIRGYISR